METARTGQVVALGPGDALLVPRNVTHTIRNPGGTPAALLGAAVLPMAAFNLDLTHGSGQVPPIVAVYGLTRLGIAGTEEGWSGVVGTRLAVAFDACVAAIGQRLSVAWQPLLPGAAIPAHAVEGQEVVVPLGGGIGYAGEPAGFTSGAIGVPGLVYATAHGEAAALKAHGPLGARVLVVSIDPVLFTGPGGAPSSNARPARGAGCGETS